MDGLDRTINVVRHVKNWNTAGIHVLDPENEMLREELGLLACCVAEDTVYMNVEACDNA